VANDESEVVLGEITLPADRSQTKTPIDWADRVDGDGRIWAVEAAGGLGYLLYQQLVASGERVVDVPPVLASRVRVLGSGRSDKNDPNDALSVAVAALRQPGLAVVRREDHAQILRMLAKRHLELTGLRTQVLRRHHPIASAGHYASYNGTAPIEVSSGGKKRHRLSLRGNRKLNHAIHMAAVTQIRYPDTPGRVYYDKKRAEGKTKKEALRALKRRISDTVYHTSSPTRNRARETPQERLCRLRGRLRILITGSSAQSSRAAPQPTSKARTLARRHTPQIQTLDTKRLRYMRSLGALSGSVMKTISNSVRLVTRFR
jgi:Transposase/Transposase IS116/IS110/IS902 family